MRWSLAFVLLALTSACLPGRDNPRDPANAPVASLRIIDQDGEVLGSASRGRDLVLDATGSTDPQDRFWCEFFRVAGDEIPLTGCASCSCPLGDLRRALPVDAEHVFRVAVRDSSGGYSTDDQALVLTNSPPVVNAGPPRTLPTGGFPWSLGEDFQVPFEAVASDPDGDPLLYHWTFGDVTLSSTSAGDPAFTRTVVSTTATHFIATVTVEENVDLPPGSGHLTSFPSTTRVVVGFPNLWTAPNENGAIERVDGGAGSLVPTNVDSGEEIPAAVYAPDAGERRLVYVYDQDATSSFPTRNNRIISAPESNLTSEGVFVFPGPGEVSIAVDSMKGLAWLHIEDASPAVCASADEALVSLTVDLLSPVSCYALPGSGDRRIEIDDASRVYSWREFTSSVSFLDEDSTTPMTLDLRQSPFDLVLGAGVRPRAAATDVLELWVAVIPGYFGGAFLPARIEVYRDPDGPSGSPPARAGFANLGVGLVTGLAFLSPNELWLEVPDQGMHRLDARVIDGYLSAEANAPPVLEAATIAVAAGVLDVIDVIADPVTGTAWAQGHATGGIHRIERDGEARLYEVGEPPGEPLAVDPAGRLVFTTAGKLHRGLSPSPDGVVDAIGLFSGGFPEADLETGGFWSALLLPPAIARVAEDGTLLRFETSVSLDGELRPPGLTRLFRLAPGRPTAYAMAATLPDFRPGPIFRVDLTTSPPRSTEMFDDTIAVQDTQKSAQIVAWGSVFEPSTPGTGPDPFVWTILGAPGSVSVLAVTTTGEPAAGNTPFPLPAGEQNALAMGAISQATNNLCLATVNGTNLVLRRITPAGTATLLNTSGLSFPAGSELTAVAALPHAGGDICFAAYNLPPGGTPAPRLIAWQDPGPGAEMQWQPSTASPPARDLDGYRITSIAAQTDSDIWVTMVPVGSLDAEKVHLYRSGNTLLEDRFLEASAPNVFVFPGSRSLPYRPPDP